MKRFFLLSLFSFIVNLSFGQIKFDIIQGDATICDWSNAKIIIDSDADEISWTPTDSLSCDTCFVFNANPSMTTTYTAVLKKKAEGNEVISVTITVKPNDAHFPQGDTLYVCKGDSKLLTLAMENTSGDVHWTSSEGLDSTIVGETMSDTLLMPLDNMIFYASAANTSDCVDSIVIQVDSLPLDRMIKVVDPKMPPYCRGQKIYMKSPDYNQDHFPNIDFFWSPYVKPDDGTPDSLYNLVWTAHDAKVYTYTREVTNGACKVTDMIDVPILKVMEITVDPKEGKGCVEDEFQIQVTAVDEDTKEVLVGAEYEWKPEGADFSCVDCDNPIATLTGNGFSKLKITLDEYCPGEGGFAAILDTEPVPVDIKSGTPPCANGITNVYVESPDMDVTYTWSVTNGEIIGCTDCNQTEIRIGNGSTTVSITASSDSYCVDGMASLVIIPNEGMLKVVIDSVSAVCAGGIANVSIKEPIDGIEYIWTVTNGELTGCSSCIETQVRTSTSEITTVTVKATSTSCEEGTASVIIPIAASLDLLPKVFTPNSDNTNDFFTFYDKNVSEFIMPVDQIVSFQIFNRWGTKVYDNDTPEKGWDGKINGKDASQDVYLYQVELGDNFCNQKLVGDVTLLR